MSLALTLLALQLSPSLSVTSSLPFNLARARRIYSDAHRVVSAAKQDGPLPLPFLHIHVLRRLECGGASSSVRDDGKLVACAFRERSHIRVVLTRDDPRHLLQLLLYELDYAGQTYLSPNAQARVAKMILGKVDVRELR